MVPYTFPPSPKRTPVGAVSYGCCASAVRFRRGRTPPLPLLRPRPTRALLSAPIRSPSSSSTAECGCIGPKAGGKHPPETAERLWNVRYEQPALTVGIAPPCNCAAPGPLRNAIRSLESTSIHSHGSVAPSNIDSTTQTSFQICLPSRVSITSNPSEAHLSTTTRTPSGLIAPVSKEILVDPHAATD